MDKENQTADLLYINDYLLSFFAFAAGSGSTVFQKEEWMAFSPEDGAWLWMLYEKDSENGADMRRAIDQLFEMEHTERDGIYRAIAHDMKFDEELAESFSFETVLLEKEEQKLIEDFFLYFYKVVLCTAHFEMQGLSEGSLGRKELADMYFRGKNRALKHSCPVCLQTVTDARREEDIEHYFPKSWVPCLVLHPGNLYFCCPACNQRYKRVRTPFGRGKKDLRRIFLPYIDTVREKVQLTFCHEKEADQVRLRPADPGEPGIEDKIKAFDHLFRLEERWSGLLEYYYVTRQEQYQKLGIRDPEALREQMDGDVYREKAISGHRPEKNLETRYLDWLRHSQLKAFYSNLTQEGREAVILPATERESGNTPS